MLDSVVKQSGISEELLIPEFKAIHERNGTAEYAFSMEELPSLKAKHPGEDLAILYEPAIMAFREARTAALKLYPKAQETLETLKDKGCLLVGYTESMAFYSNYRVRKLGLDRVLDYLYSPPDHNLPAGLTPKEIRRYDPERYSLRRTEHRHTPKGEMKPNPRVLLDIIKDIGGTPEETVYVGDNLIKDVLMAQTASVADVWAKYGDAKDRPEYGLLCQVTHWPASDVEREKVVKPADVEPSYVLESSFSEILDKFEFVPFIDKSPDRLSMALDIWKKTVDVQQQFNDLELRIRDKPPDRLSMALEIWKKTVDVQQHFNDLELRIRNYAVTVLAALFGVTAFAFKENLQISLFGTTTSAAVGVLVAATLGWSAFYFMDRFWYHNLLKGAVDHGMSIESRLKNELPDICLTAAIGKASPTAIRGLKIRSSEKITIFYSVGLLLLALLALLAFFSYQPPSKMGGPTTTSASPAASAPGPPDRSAKSPTPTERKASEAPSQPKSEQGVPQRSGKQ
jgi:FMN phosphatase YigB (HAD superfamily)